MSVDDVLSPEQRTVMLRVLAEESARRDHVVIYLSGAHAYGFPSHDSDLDLKAIHVARTDDLVGLDLVPSATDRTDVIDGVEIDYTSNELAAALAGILAGNGNFIERVLGRMVIQQSPLFDGLREVVRGALSRRVHKHYRGFARNQLAGLEKEPTTKKLLYVLRTTTTGIHLLETGELETDLTKLLEHYDLADAWFLIKRKRAGERLGLDPDLLVEWYPRIDRLFARLDTAHAASSLPESPHNEAQMRKWLLDLRRSR